MDERRGAPRHRVLKTGKIVLADGTSVIDCTVRNLSETGALISVENAVVMPEEFTMQVDGNPRRCIVMWRRFDRLGVKFR